ncbi:hypothetical protein [Rhodoplanes roseus]|uniref:Uncharacterized protein n=1 Tax=Rhodoplanes roseus TaxID=29409 RepID=A0A327L153_9BRAD|nr:hypothetical protein [Rhodoplanes roseus]RAI44689.1 hypothetical protein CH341_07685 [Rhodoplanes roseus]
MIRPPGFYWARVDIDGAGPAEEPTVVEVDGDGDVSTIGRDEPLDPNRVEWIGLAVSPRA